MFGNNKRKIEQLENEINRLNGVINSTSPNIIDLIRRELSGVSVDFTGMIKGVYDGQIQYHDITDGMDENEKRDFLIAVTNLNNGTLKKIANYLVNIQGNMSLRESQNETQRNFALATINGIELFLETIEGLANKPEEPEEKMTDREKHSVI